MRDLPLPTMPLGIAAEPGRLHDMARWLKGALRRLRRGRRTMA